MIKPPTFGLMSDPLRTEHTRRPNLVVSLLIFLTSFKQDKLTFNKGWGECHAESPGFKVPSEEKVVDVKWKLVAWLLNIWCQHEYSRSKEKWQRL